MPVACESVRVIGPDSIMSNAFPAGTPSRISVMTTSARSASTILCAVVEPTNPLPTTVTFLRIPQSPELTCDVSALLREYLVRCYVRICLHYDLQCHVRDETAAAAPMFSIIADANAAVPTFVAPSINRSKSYVTRFCWIVLAMPPSINFAASPHPRKSNIIAPDSITELGLITSLSAYFGAVPWVASNTPNPSPIFEPGAIPNPPTCAAHASER